VADAAVAANQSLCGNSLLRGKRTGISRKRVRSSDVETQIRPVISGDYNLFPYAIEQGKYLDNRVGLAREIDLWIMSDEMLDRENLFRKKGNGLRTPGRPFSRVAMRCR
jgi:hypothetical protein